jgi:lactate dehydrogenase-like 2-hydroxyacid dehydrogenase
MIEVLVMAPMPNLQRELEREYTVHTAFDSATRIRVLAEVGPRIRAVITYSSPVYIDRAALDHLPQLEIITFIGVGYDGVDLDAARERRIIVTNAPGIGAIDVAEHAIGLMLAIVRGVGEGDRYVRDGRWVDRRMTPTHRFSGKHLGILGLGHIGMHVARIGSAFNCKICYHNRRPREDAAYEYVASARDLANRVDYLIVAVPGGATTHHLVDEAVLTALGPDGVLVNVGRGSAVDEAALVAALTNRRIAGAALDVFENEPHVSAALIGCPNLLLHPHRGGSTWEANEERATFTVDNLRAYFNGGPVQARVA